MRNVALAIAVFGLAECVHADGLSVPARPTVSATPIRINEVAPRGTGPDGWVELFNPTASAVDLADWTVTAGDVVRSFSLPAGAMIPPRGFLVIDEASFPAGLQATDAVHLFSRSGVEADSFFWAQMRDTTYGHCPDGTGEVLAIEPTKAAPNACPD